MRKNGAKVYENKLSFPSISFPPKAKASQYQKQENKLLTNEVPEIDIDMDESVPFKDGIYRDIKNKNKDLKMSNLTENLRQWRADRNIKADYLTFVENIWRSLWSVSFKDMIPKV